MNTTMRKALTGMLFLLVFAVCSTTAFAGILKSPYLIYPGQNTTMEVLWQDTATETSNTLSWGTDTTYGLGNVTVPEYGSFNQHAYTITGLTPNTTYYYQVADATSGVYGTGSFITAPDENATSIRFLAMGDSRSDPVQLDALMAAMGSFYSQTGNQDYQRLVIHNGDWVSTDGESYWTNQWFSSSNMSDVRSFTANTPLNGCKGNHDDASGYSATFPKYFPFPYQYMTAKVRTCTAYNTDGTCKTYNCTNYDGNGNCLDSSNNNYYNNLYWSFDYGPIHFTIIDEYSPFTPGSNQYTWIQNDLASTTKPWKIVVYHAPSYSAGADADNTAIRVLEDVVNGTDVISKNNVDLIYCGHSHNYARTGAYNAAQAGGDPIALNVPHITSGGGGAPIYAVDQTNGKPFLYNGNMVTTAYPHVITAWPSLEFMTFDIEGNTLTMTAYQVNGLGGAYWTANSANFSKAPPTLTPPSTTLTPIETTVLHHFSKNATSQVNVTTSNFGYNRATKTYNGTLTITNNGPDLTGNVHVVLDGILNLGTATVPGVGNPDNQYFLESGQATSPLPKPTSIIATNPATGPASLAGSGLISNVTLLNQTGSNNGEPMIQVSSTGLANGASVTIPLQFSNPSNGKIPFNPVTYQE